MIQRRVLGLTMYEVFGEGVWFTARKEYKGHKSRTSDVLWYPSVGQSLFQHMMACAPTPNNALGLTPGFCTSCGSRTGL